MKIILLFLIIFSSVPVYSQIMNDSTVQAVTYWNQGQSYKYSIENETYQVSGTDTTSRLLITYDVRVTVVDSSSESYTIRWDYSNFATSITDSTIQNLMKISEGLPVIFTIDPNGAYMELVNWREIKEFITTVISALRKKYQDYPFMNAPLDKIESLYTTKESIEATSVKDIRQFHNFYGASYTLGFPGTGTVVLPNHYGGAPLHAEVQAELYQIDKDEDSFTLRYFQTINEEELRTSMIQHFSKITNSLPQDETSFNFESVKDENITASVIHISGWLLDSYQISKVTLDDNIKVETRNIRLVD